jgi:hypothetical protein
MQVNGTVGTTNVKWPFEFKDVAQAFTFMKLSFDLPSVGCVLAHTTGNSFYVRLLGYTLFPPALIFAMFLPTLWAAAARQEAELTARLAGMAIRKALLLLFVVYPKVRSATAFGPFAAVLKRCLAGLADRAERPRVHRSGARRPVPQVGSACRLR